MSDDPKHRKVKLSDVIDLEKVKQANSKITIGKVPERPYKGLGKQCDRLSCQYSMVHQHCGETPLELRGSFSLLLETEEQPFHRRLTLGEGKQFVIKFSIQSAIESSGLTKPAYMMIENRAGRGKKVTPEERELLQRQHVIVHIGDAKPFCVRPGRPFCGELLEPNSIYLEASEGSIPVNVTIMPG